MTDPAPVREISEPWTEAEAPTGPIEPYSPAEAKALLGRLDAAIGEVVIGAEGVVEALAIALAVGGHVLVEGVPGIAKTFLARTFSHALGLSFQRIQFTPDVLPADIIGSLVMDPRDRSFVYRAGPLFSQVVLADEINRAPPKVQSALLEAMQEGQVTVDRRSYPLPRPFLVLATENPIEQEGTYPLPEAELDRFLFRWTMSYPSEVDEHRIVRTQLDPKDAGSLPTVLSASELDRFRRSVATVRVEDDVLRYVTAIVRATRDDRRVEAGASPRAAVQYMRAARAHAYLAGRSYVLPDDVQALAFPVLNHRLIVRPEFRSRHATSGTSAVGLEVVRTIVSETLGKIPAPR